jgi:hypothetical protein
MGLACPDSGRAPGRRRWAVEIGACGSIGKHVLQNKALASLGACAATLASTASCLHVLGLIERFHRIFRVSDNRKDLKIFWYTAYARAFMQPLYFVFFLGVIK